MNQIYKIIDFIKNKNDEILKKSSKFCDGFKVIDLRENKRYCNINYFFVLLNKKSHFDGYLGKTKSNIEDRIYEHLSSTRLKNENSIFHSLIKKYGVESFICFVFADYKRDKSCYRNEEKNIKICKANNIRLANMTNGNEGSKGLIANEKTKEKIANKMRDRNLWWKNKISKSLKGYKQTTEHRINNALGGLKVEIKNKKQAKQFIKDCNLFVKTGMGWISISNVMNKNKYFGFYMCKNAYLNLYMWCCWRFKINPIKAWRVKNKMLNEYFQK